MNEQELKDLAAKYNLDANYASELVSVSTVISIITIPLVVLSFGL